MASDIQEKFNDLKKAYTEHESINFDWQAFLVLTQNKEITPSDLYRILSFAFALEEGNDSPFYKQKMKKMPREPDVFQKGSTFILRTFREGGTEILALVDMSERSDVGVEISRSVNSEHLNKLRLFDPEKYESPEM